MKHTTSLSVVAFRKVVSADETEFMPASEQEIDRKPFRQPFGHGDRDSQTTAAFSGASKPARNGRCNHECTGAWWTGKASN